MNHRWMLLLPAIATVSFSFLATAKIYRSGLISTECAFNLLSIWSAAGELADVIIGKVSVSLDPDETKTA